MHGVELRREGRHLGGRDVRGDKKFVGLADGQRRKIALHFSHEGLEFRDLLGMLLGGERWPGFNARGLHPLERLRLLLLAALTDPAAPGLGGTCALGLGRVDRLAAGHDLRDVCHGDSDCLRLSLGPQAERDGFPLAIPDSFENRPHQSAARAEFDEVERLADEGPQSVGEFIGSAWLQTSKECCPEHEVSGEAFH